jgi:hypothetical protein
MNFYNKQEYYMNLCNFQQFLKLSRINKIFQIISLFVFFDVEPEAYMLQIRYLIN